MAKFKKKPVYFEAIQLSDANIDEAIEFCGDKIKSHPLIGVVIETIEGDMLVNKFDFIIKDIHGDLYPPCNPDIFEKTYEKVEDSNINDYESCSNKH